MNFVSLARVTHPSETVALCDAGINHQRQSILSTHLFRLSAASFPGIGRPNPRHSNGVSVGFVDGHAKWMRMTMPLYPDVPGKWSGNRVTNPADPEYAYGLWDLE
jgi:prepilin-type processing-associated H-X9-DG protein